MWLLISKYREDIRPLHSGNSCKRLIPPKPTTAVLHEGKGLLCYFPPFSPILFLFDPKKSNVKVHRQNATMCSWWRSKQQFQSQGTGKPTWIFPWVSAGFRLDLQSQDGKNNRNPCALFMSSSSKEPRTLEVKPLGTAPFPGSCRQGELADTSSTGCSHPSGMPADVFSRRAEAAQGFCCWIRHSVAQAEILPLASSPAAAQRLAHAAGAAEPMWTSLGLHGLTAATHSLPAGSITGDFCPLSRKS